MDNQITKKLWIINTFWNIYLKDNYHFKDLNIKKNWLILRIRIKNVSMCNFRLKNPQKRSPNWTKNSNMGLAPKMAYWHSWSANWPKCSTQPRNFLIVIKLIFFNFLEIRTRSNSYLTHSAYFLSILTSINRGKRSKLGALLLWLLCSPYVKDILKALSLGTSFL